MYFCYRSLYHCFATKKVVPSTAISEGPATADIPEPETDPARKYRIEAFRDFMLALSDQQLVTGLAMLVAGFGGFSDITIYSANVVSALAYFSASVHMGTLDFLTTYLRKHGIVKGFRVVAMMGTAGLLVFLLGMQVKSNWWVRYGRSNLFVSCALWNPTNDYTTLDDLGAALGKAYVIANILLQHGERAWSLYSRLGRLPQGEGVYTSKRWQKHKISNARYRILIYKQRARELMLDNPSWRRTCKSWLMAESFAFHETYDSRLWDIGNLLYSNIYGAILIFQYRRQHEGTVGPFNSWGFGQIVPVFLLALLLFAATESVYGAVLLILSDVLQLT